MWFLSQEHLTLMTMTNVKLYSMCLINLRVKDCRVWYFVVEKAIYIIQLDKTICITLKAVRGVQLSIVGSSFTQYD